MHTTMFLVFAGCIWGECYVVWPALEAVFCYVFYAGKRVDF